jgi:hypothetical protein
MGQGGADEREIYARGAARTKLEFHAILAELEAEADGRRRGMDEER